MVGTSPTVKRLLREAAKEFRDGLLQHRVEEIARDLRRGLEHEAAPRQPRVRDDDPRLLHHEILVEEDVEVHLARPPPDAALPPADAGLHGLQQGQQVPRTEFRLDQSRAVEVAPLGRAAHGVRLPEGARADHAHRTLLLQEVQRRADVLLPRLEVAADADEDPAHRSSPITPTGLPPGTPGRPSLLRRNIQVTGPESV